MTQKIRRTVLLTVMLSSTWLLANCGSSSSSSQQQTDGGTDGGPVVVKLASLDGAQETPATMTAAFGAGVLAVNTTTGAVSGFIVTSGLSPNAAHVHDAARGTPGGIIVPLSGTAGSDLWVVPDGATPLTAAQIADFIAGNLYFNAHTTANPNGEIRGQLDKTGSVKLAALDGAQETPAVTSAAYGAGILTVDPTTGNVAGFITTSGLSPNAAHVHDAARGTPGGIIVPLSGTAGGSLWVVPDGAPAITAAQVADFAAGNLYFNAHTTANPNGEIRGQLEKGGTFKFAALDGSQETPPVTSAAYGAGILAVDDSNGNVAGFIATSGLSPNAAHVHDAARGTPGSIIVPLSGTAGSSLWIVPDNATAITAAQVAGFGAGTLYYNAHTTANPNGEIRGQLDKP